jgi:hypothetical protein
VGDRAGEGRACGSLGIAYCSQGDFSQAITYHAQDLAIAKEVGDRALSDQGQLAADRGRGGKRVRERERESSNRYDRTFVATAGSLSLHELSL